MKLSKEQVIQIILLILVVFGVIYFTYFMLENPITHINVYKPPPNKTLTTPVTYEDIMNSNCNSRNYGGGSIQTPECDINSRNFCNKKLEEDERATFSSSENVCQWEGMDGLTKPFGKNKMCHIINKNPNNNECGIIDIYQNKDTSQVMHYLPGDTQGDGTCLPSINPGDFDGSLYRDDPTNPTIKDVMKNKLDNLQYYSGVGPQYEKDDIPTSINNGLYRVELKVNQQTINTNWQIKLLSDNPNDQNGVTAKSTDIDTSKTNVNVTFTLPPNSAPLGLFLKYYGTDKTKSILVRSVKTCQITREEDGEEVCSEIYTLNTPYQFYIVPSDYSEDHPNKTGDHCLNNSNLINPTNSNRVCDSSKVYQFYKNYKSTFYNTLWVFNYSHKNDQIPYQFRPTKLFNLIVRVNNGSIVNGRNKIGFSHYERGENNSDFDLYLDMGPVLEGGKTYVIPIALNLMPIDGKNVFPDRLYHSFTGTGKPGSYSNEPSTDETNINNFQIFIQRISAKGPHSNIFEISTNNEDMGTLRLSNDIHLPASSKTSCSGITTSSTPEQCMACLLDTQFSSWNHKSIPVNSIVSGSLVKKNSPDALPNDRCIRLSEVDGYDISTPLKSKITFLFWLYLETDNTSFAGFKPYFEIANNVIQGERIPSKKWVHVTVSIDIENTNSYILIAKSEEEVISKGFTPNSATKQKLLGGGANSDGGYISHFRIISNISISPETIKDFRQEFFQIPFRVPLQTATKDDVIQPRMTIRLLSKKENLPIAKKIFGGGSNSNSNSNSNSFTNQSNGDAIQSIEKLITYYDIWIRRDMNWCYVYLVQNTEEPKLIQLYQSDAHNILSENILSGNLVRQGEFYPTSLTVSQIAEYSGVSSENIYLVQDIHCCGKEEDKIAASWGTSVNLKPKTFIDGLENISLTN